jgi:glutamate-5-semialdehyde dehydrogenase
MTICIWKTENKLFMTILPQLEKTLKASRMLNMVSEDAIKTALYDLADEAEKETPHILVENQKDLDRMDSTDPRFDRLKLTAERISGIASDIRNVAGLPNPVGRILTETIRPNGLKITKLSVPFGVIGIIYEARPNVTFDVFSLCLKSGNACVLKGGSDAIFSNTAILQVIRQVLGRHGLPDDVVTLLPAGREETYEMMQANGYIDLIIPRGSQGLIDFVRKNSSIPVIETGAGICHTYFDASGDAKKGADIVFNAKTRRPSVCNALDCLIVHSSRISDLPGLTAKLAGKDVLIYADEISYNILKSTYPEHLLQPATEESFGTEFLSLKMAIKIVDSMEEALDQIARYSSKHSEAIVSEDATAVITFRKMVDAAAVYSNVSTAFTDGAQFGLGAEIGISTQKLHARGPMALEELTSYKWIVEGNGQVRPQ